MQWWHVCLCGCVYVCVCVCASVMSWKGCKLDKSKSIYVGRKGEQRSKCVKLLNTWIQRVKLHILHRRGKDIFSNESIEWQAFIAVSMMWLICVSLRQVSVVFEGCYRRTMTRARYKRNSLLVWLLVLIAFAIILVRLAILQQNPAISFFKKDSLNEFGE